MIGYWREDVRGQKFIRSQGVSLQTKKTAGYRHRIGLPWSEYAGVLVPKIDLTAINRSVYIIGERGKQGPLAAATKSEVSAESEQ